MNSSPLPSQLPLDDDDIPDFSQDTDESFAPIFFEMMSYHKEPRKYIPSYRIRLMRPVFSRRNYGFQIS